MNNIFCSTNPCLMTRSAFLSLVQSLISICQGQSDLDLHTKSARTILKQLLSEESIVIDNVVQPWRTEFEQTHATIVLSSLCDKSDLEKVTCVVRLLRSDLYEVRQVALEFLEKNIKKTNGKCGNDVDWKIRDDLVKSKEIFSEVVAMVMGQEKHPECLIQVNRFRPCHADFLCIKNMVLFVNDRSFCHLSVKWW